MPLTTQGRDAIASAIIDDSFTPFSNANAHIGVGDDDTAFSAAQTDLQAVTNKLRKGMDPTYPQRTDNVITMHALFGTSDANWDWEEWGIFNASSSGVMLTRKAEFIGTKTSAMSWLAVVTAEVVIGS